jgi:hypothetical protein
MNRVRRWFSRWPWRITGLIVAVAMVFVLAFWIFTRINDDDWDRQVLANFGSFWSPIVAFANMIIVLSLTLYLRRVERNRSETLERPVVTILMKEDKSGYLLKNIGKGAALNVYCYCISKESIRTKSFAQKRICYSIASGGDFHKVWLNGEVILVEYYDIFNKQYFCMMQGDRFCLFDENLQPLLRPGSVDIGEYAASFREYMQWDRSAPTWP